MSPLVNLRIDAALDGKQEQFDRILAERGALEQHWSGAGGAGGDVRPSSGLHEILEDRLDLSHMDESDLRHASRTLRAKFPDDPGVMALASHVEAWEAYQAEQFEKEMSMNANTIESFLREHGVPMLEQRTPVSNQDSPGQHPRQRGWMPYPTGVRPVAEEVDREVRGALDSPMSAKLRALAQEVAGMAKLSSSPRQRARLIARSRELERMSVKQFEREGQSEVVPSDDPSEFNNVVNGAARNLDAEARAVGAQDGDSLDSYDDWPKSDAQSDDAIQDQADTARDAALQLDKEDVPQVPRPGRRIDEDNLGDASLHADDVPARRKNTATHLALPKGDAYRGRPARRYSAFGRESLRESGDLTEFLLGEMSLHYAGSHGAW